VEVKRIHASLSVISQVMAYADHWRILPPGEVDHGLLDFADEGGRAKIFGDALLELKSWADGRSKPKVDVGELHRLGKIPLKRLAPEWARRPVTNINSLAQQRWNCDRLP